MQTDIAALFDVFDDHRRRREPLVLATIVSTAGSTYRKAGARMLISPGGQTFGLLSGGCFESDLAEKAARVLETGSCQIVEYDMRGKDDLIWGLGLGCDGAVSILLQPLGPDQGYEPFRFIADSILQAHACAVATVIDGGTVLADGVTVAADDRDRSLCDPDDEMERQLLERCRSSLASGERGANEIELGGRTVGIFLDRLDPAPHLLLLGGGPDAVPVARLARGLHWRVTIADHRDSWVVEDRFPDGCRVVAIDPPHLDKQIDLAGVSAAVVMTHNFRVDQHLLRALTRRPPRYVGLLGPVARRNALLAELDSDERTRIDDLVRGPVGLDIGGEGPEAIALSLIAEIHAVLEQRSGGPLGAG